MDNNERPIYICLYIEIIRSFKVLNFAIYLKLFFIHVVNYIPISPPLPPFTPLSFSPHVSIWFPIIHQDLF